MTLGASGADGAGVPHANRFVVGLPSANSRRRRSAVMDHRLRELFAAAGGGPGLALVAVGGYGRSELAPYSDVDVVLVHDRRVGRDLVASMADRIWYPLWNDGVDLDHAVRDADQMRQAAAGDLRAAIGMLDLRHVAGDEQLSHALRSAALTDWRRAARRRLPELAAAGRDRAERFGELAHSAVPDLKESVGGLRDGVVLRALVATWLVDVPHAEAEACRAELLDIRDALQAVTGRRTNRLAPELLPDLAEALAATPQALASAGGAATAATLDGRAPTPEGRAATPGLASTPEGLARHVRALGRRVAHLSLQTWRRIDQALERPRRRASMPRKQSPSPGRRSAPDRPPSRRPQLIPMDRGVARVGGEVVLTAEASPPDDPGLSLRVAALAAEGGLLVAPSTAARLARSAGPLPEPWSSDLRRLFVQLLASGSGLPPVWEELDQAGVVRRWLPEWEAVRHLPSEAAIHRYTVDWHSVQACVEAASRLRRVSRPDLLVVATLLHDIGKGQRGDHSVAGAEIASKVASRMGFAAADVERIGALVARHLLLPEAATRRDLDDPATIDAVASEVGELSTLDLLAVLTESDARATAPAAWSSWRAGLVGRLVAACEARLRERRADGQPAPQVTPAPTVSSEPAPSCDGTPVAGHPVRLAVEATVDGSRIRVEADDRTGLLADLAGAWAWAGLVIRGCRAYSVDGRAVSEWDLGSPPVDPATLAHRLRRVLDNDVRLGDRLPATAPDPPPRVEAIDTASPTATVVEIRAQDQRGLLWRACRALARSGVNVRSAHVDTLGPQAVDVLYLVDEAGRSLSPGAVAAAVSAMRSALT